MVFGGPFRVEFWTSTDGLLDGTYEESNGASRYRFLGVVARLQLQADRFRLSAQSDVALLEWRYEVRVRLRLKARRVLCSTTTALSPHHGPIDLPFTISQADLLFREADDALAVRVDLDMLVVRETYLPNLRDAAVSPRCDSVLFAAGRAVFHVDAQLLSLNSPLFAHMLAVGAPAVVDVAPDDLLELLYQIYPTSRPVSQLNVRALVRVATALRVDSVKRRCEDFLVADSFMSLGDKLALADTHGLWRCFIRLLWRYDGAVLRAYVRDGFDARATLSDEGVRLFVDTMRAIDSASPNETCTAMSQPARDFSRRSSASSREVRVLAPDGSPAQTLFAESAVLEQLLPHVRSAGPIDVCGDGDVLVALLRHVHPEREPVASQHVTDVLDFAADNHLSTVQEHCEGQLLRSRQLGADKLLQLLKVAERLNLPNVRRVCLYRLECKSPDERAAVESLPQFAALGENLQAAVRYATTAGWAVHEERPADNRARTMPAGSLDSPSSSCLPTERSSPAKCSTRRHVVAPPLASDYDDDEHTLFDCHRVLGGGRA